MKREERDALISFLHSIVYQIGKLDPEAHNGLYDELYELEETLGKYITDTEGVE
jgi:hypothetical protein